MIENHKFQTTNGQTIELNQHTVRGQRFIDGNRNIIVACKNLQGGSYSVHYRLPSGESFISHVEDAEEADSVIIAGKAAPIFEAVEVRFNNIPNGTTTTLYLTTWERAL